MKVVIIVIIYHISLSLHLVSGQCHLLWEYATEQNVRCSYYPTDL